MGILYELSPHPEWMSDLHTFLRPYWDELVNGEFVEGVTAARLTVPEMQGWMLQLYPFIHSFPKFLAEALTKVEDEYARSYLIDNIRVEKAHAEQWLAMGQGFGLRKEQMIDVAEGTKPVLRDVQSLSDWLWYINTKGSLAEAVAATSFAIEGVTGDMCRKALAGFESYAGRHGVDMNPKTSKWMRAHGKYDDLHPKIALEVVKRYAISPRIQSRAMLAAKRSLQLLHLAFNTSYRAFSISEVKWEDISNLRREDRRQTAQAIAFPERRFGERRGHQLRAVA